MQPSVKLSCRSQDFEGKKSEVGAFLNWFWTLGSETAFGKSDGFLLLGA